MSSFWNIKTIQNLAQAQYINDIEQYRNQMKILAQELATDYRNQRKSIIFLKLYFHS